MLKAHFVGTVSSLTFCVALAGATAPTAIAQSYDGCFVNGQRVPDSMCQGGARTSAPSMKSSPMLDSLMSTSRILGGAIVKSLISPPASASSAQSPPGNQSDTRAARQALDNWANGTPGQANHTAPRQGAAGQLDQWASEVRSEDLRDAPNSTGKHKAEPKVSSQAQAQSCLIPAECVDSGQTFDEKGNPNGRFYQCWPEHKDKYCVQCSTTGALQDVPCNTVTK